MTKVGCPAFSPAMCALIDALAEDLVREYLTEQAAPGNDPDAARTNPVLRPLADAA